ncbi:MAG: hypothetical protein ABI723_00245 [Bacteroidia bacterium]
MESEIFFEEKQRLGFNNFTLMFRLALAAFCYIAYYFTDDREINGDLLLWIGNIILIISILMFFVVHLHTKVMKGSVELTGLWSMKKVKIDLNSITSAEKSRYQTFQFNNPAYNLHFKGTIRFYTSGKEAVVLTDKDGLKYMIGSQRSNDLLKAVQQQLAG